MPKKTPKDGIPLMPPVAVDESYVLSMRIQMLEDKNAALKVISQSHDYQPFCLPVTITSLLSVPRNTASFFFLQS
jgi:hypothetical protein